MGWFRLFSDAGTGRKERVSHVDSGRVFVVVLSPSNGECRIRDVQESAEKAYHVITLHGTSLQCNVSDMVMRVTQDDSVGATIEEVVFPNLSVRVALHRLPTEVVLYITSEQRTVALDAEDILAKLDQNQNSKMRSFFVTAWGADGGEVGQNGNLGARSIAVRFSRGASVSLCDAVSVVLESLSANRSKSQGRDT